MRLTLLLILPGAFLTGCSQSSGEDPWLFAHLAPQSGVERAFGSEQKNGIAMAVDAINKEGPIDDRSLAMIHVSSKNEIGQLRAETARLLTVNKVRGILLGSNAQHARQLAPTAQQFKAPVLTSAELLPGSHRGALTLTPTFDAMAKVLTAFISEDLNLKSIELLVRQSSPYCTEMASRIQAQWQQQPGQAITIQGFEESTDWPLEIPRKQGRILVLLGTAKDLQVLQTKQAEQLDRPPLLFAGEILERAGIRRTVVSGSVYLPTLYFSEKFTKTGKDFLQSYEQRFHTPPGIFAMQGYEMAHILGQALRQTGSAKGPLQGESLSQEKTFQGLTGPITFQDQYAKRPIYVISRSGSEEKLIRSSASDQQKKQEKKPES